MRLPCIMNVFWQCSKLCAIFHLSYRLFIITWSWLIVIIIIMKNFNRCDSHGHLGWKCCELAQRAHSHESHAFTRAFTSTQLTTMWCEAPAQLLVFSVCWVFLCFRNPPNSDMDQRIVLVRACTQGGWAHRKRVSITFLTRKNSQIFLALLTGFKPSSFGSESNGLPIGATPSINKQFIGVGGYSSHTRPHWW